MVVGESMILDVAKSQAKARPGHAKGRRRHLPFQKGNPCGRRAIPGDFKRAGREGALPGRADGTGATKFHIQWGRDNSPRWFHSILKTSKTRPMACQRERHHPSPFQGCGGDPLGWIQSPPVCMPWAYFCLQFDRE